MAKLYDPVGSKLRKGKIRAGDLRHAGRLVRACAEIEHLITLYLFRLARVSVGSGLILIGKLPTRNRLGLLTKLTIAGTAEATKVNECFVKSDYERIIAARNIIAHGVFLGVTVPLGQYAFQMDTWDIDPDDSKRPLGAEVAIVSSASLKFLAEKAEELISFIEETLELEASLEKYRAPQLEGHLKARSQGKGRART